MKMAKIYTVAAMIVMALISVNPAMGADVTTGVDMYSAYVWRGITFNDGMVIQPSVDITKGGFGLNVWGNMDIDDYDNNVTHGQISEIDLTVSYTLPIEAVDISVGYIEYTFPNAEAEAAREIYASFGISPLEGLSIGMTAYYEVDTIEDYYVNLNVAYGFNVNDKLGVEIGASAGYIGEDYSVGEDGGLNDYNFSFGSSYAVSDALSVSASINYAGSFDDDVLPEYDDVGFASYDVDVYGSIGVSYSF